MTVSLEYEIVRPGSAPVGAPEYSWEEVVIGITEVEPLVGFRVKCRPIEPSGPQGPQYPSWELVSQTITISKPDCGPQVYGGTEGEYLGAQWSEGGIDDETGYFYTEVFDQSHFYYLPAFSGDSQENFTGEIEAKNGFPEGPYDPENDIYPMDAITRYSPDQRPSVVITYTVDTEYIVHYLDILGVQGEQGIQGIQGIQGPQEPPIILTDSITIYHEVRQPDNNWGEQLKALLHRTYFFHGHYH